MSIDEAKVVGLTFVTNAAIALLEGDSDALSVRSERINASTCPSLNWGGSRLKCFGVAIAKVAQIRDANSSRDYIHIYVYMKPFFGAPEAHFTYSDVSGGFSFPSEVCPLYSFDYVVVLTIIPSQY
jgi:hypothetical protein